MPCMIGFPSASTVGTWVSRRIPEVSELNTLCSSVHLLRTVARQVELVGRIAHSALEDFHGTCGSRSMLAGVQRATNREALQPDTMSGASSRGK